MNATNNLPIKEVAKNIRKPDGLPKIKLGAGKHLAYISDTLFDEDLK